MNELKFVNKTSVDIFTSKKRCHPGDAVFLTETEGKAIKGLKLANRVKKNEG